MKYEHRLRLLARAWIPESSSRANAKEIGIATNVLGEDGSMQAASRLDVNTGTLTPVSMFTTVSGWSVVWSRDSIDIEKGPETATSLEAFCDKSKELLSKLIGDRMVDAQRLALVTEGLLRDMTPEQLAVTAKSLLVFPRTFEPVPFEWDWRCVQHVVRNFGDTQAKTNTIAAVRRSAGSLLTHAKPVSFDRLRVELDINTIAADQVRFTPEQVSGFFSNAPHWVAEIEGEISAISNMPSEAA